MAALLKKDSTAIAYLNHAHDVRGRLINQIAVMENAMDEYICKYFCSTTEKRTELREIIVSTKHLTFGAKSEIIRCLIVKTGEVTQKEANRLYNALLNKIAKNRNIIAHCILDTSKKSIDVFEADKETISFFKYDNVKKPITYNKKDVKELNELVFAVHQYFSGLNSPFRIK